MKFTNTLPSAAFLKVCFTYNSKTGELFRKERPKTHFSDAIRRGRSLRYVGKVAGCKNYRVSGKPLRISVLISVNGRKRLFAAHHIIFAMKGINIADGMEIDHRNLNPFDNSWKNLRLATHGQNNMNRNGKSGRILPKGVKHNGSGFMARITVNHKTIHLGTFRTIDGAVMAYANAAKEHHGQFART